MISIPYSVTFVSIICNCIVKNIAQPLNEAAPFARVLCRGNDLPGPDLAISERVG